MYFHVFSRSFLQGKRKELGDIFLTTLDLTGTIIRSRHVVCIFESQNMRLAKYKFKIIGHCGLYCHSSSVYAAMASVCDNVFSRRDMLISLESAVTPIVREFLKQLVYETTFSFADKLNQ